MAFDSAAPMGAGDDAGATGETEPQPQPDEMEQPGTPEENPEEATLSLEMFGGVAPKAGQSITLKVSAVDPESGTVSVVLPSGKPSGMADAAAAFDSNQ